MIMESALPLPQQLRNRELLKQQLALLSPQEDPALKDCLDAKQICLSKKHTLVVESQCMAEGRSTVTKTVHIWPTQHALLQHELAVPLAKGGLCFLSPRIWEAKVTAGTRPGKTRKLSWSIVLLERMLSACSFSESSQQAEQRVHMSVLLSRVPAHLSHPRKAPNMWGRKLPDDFNP